MLSNALRDPLFFGHWLIGYNVIHVRISLLGTFHPPPGKLGFLSTFEADLSACRHRSPSISAFQTPSQGQRAQLNDATVQDCVMTKGYKIGTEGR